MVFQLVDSGCACVARFSHDRQQHSAATSYLHTKHQLW